MTDLLRLDFLISVLSPQLEHNVTGLVSATWLSHFWSCHHYLTFLFLLLSSTTWLSYFWYCHFYLTVLFLFLSSMTCISYFWPYQIIHDSPISGLVIYDLTLLFLVLCLVSSYFINNFSGLVIYNMTLLWLDSLISGLVLSCLSVPYSSYQ